MSRIRLRCRPVTVGGFWRLAAFVPSHLDRIAKRLPINSAMEYLGEIAGLGAALMWALGSVLFHRLGANITPLVLNLYKGVLAIAMLVVVLAVRGELLAAIDTQALVVLVVSGVIGIGIGDTAFFAALNRLGERRTVLMAETLAPPMAVMIAFVVLAEVLSVWAIVGIVITIAGVCWVIVERTSATTLARSKMKAGIALGALAALCQAIGAVMSRAVLVDSDVSPMWSALVRLGGGVAILLFWIPLARQSFVPSSVRSLRLWRLIVVATFIGTFLGVVLQQLALKHAEAGVVQTLLGTSALFILPLVAWRGERISVRAIVGAAIAVVGVAMLFANNWWPVAAEAVN